MKKTIAVTLIILIIINFAMPKLSYAAPTTQAPDKLESIDAAITKDGMESLMSDGSTTVNSQDYDGDGNASNKPRTQTLETGITVGSGVIRFLVSILVSIPYVINAIISGVVGTNTFTIEELLTNQYDLFGIKFWETNTTGKNASTVNTIRSNVATWYYSIRNIAIVGMVVILIYIGIRMATLIVSDDASAQKQARYKKLFVNWLVGLALLIVLHFLLIFLISIIEQFTQLILHIFQQNQTQQGLESKLIDHTWTEIWSKSNKHPFWEFLIYFMLVFYEFKFFVSYFLRAIKIYFYIVISPLVCMTYAIDKIGDDKSQAFDNWSKEIISEILQQPIHLITYSIFIFSANALIDSAPILMVLMLYSIGKIEKILRNALMIKPGRFAKGPGDIQLMKPAEWMKVGGK